MSDIKYQTVPAGVVDPMQSDRQFHSTQIGGQMTAGLRYNMEDPLSERLAQLLCFVVADPMQRRKFPPFVQKNSSLEYRSKERYHLFLPASILARSHRKTVPEKGLRQVIA